MTGLITPTGAPIPTTGPAPWETALTSVVAKALERSAENRSTVPVFVALAIYQETTTTLMELDDARQQMMKGGKGSARDDAMLKDAMAQLAAMMPVMVASTIPVVLGQVVKADDQADQA